MSFEGDPLTEDNKKRAKYMGLSITILFLLTVITDLVYLICGIQPNIKIVLHSICMVLDVYILWNVYKQGSEVIAKVKFVQNFIIALLIMVMISSAVSIISAFERLNI